MPKKLAFDLPGSMMMGCLECRCRTKFKLVKDDGNNNSSWCCTVCGESAVLECDYAFYLWKKQNRKKKVEEKDVSWFGSKKIKPIKCKKKAVKA